MSQNPALKDLYSESLSEAGFYADNAKSLIAITKTEFGWSACSVLSSLGISFLSNRFKLEGQDTLIGFLFDYLFPFSQTVVLFSTF